MTALREKLHAFVDEIADLLERATTVDEWVDQRNSPLGRRRHCELARKGIIPSSKDGRFYRMKRSDIEHYLKSKAVVVVDPEASEEAEVARVISMIAHKRRTK